MEMHHSKYENSPAFIIINDSIWKSLRLTSSNITFQNGPCIRVIDDILYSCVDFNCKIVPEILLAPFVIIDGFVKLNLCFRMK